MGAWADVHVVVMAGGSGTRFWPKSTGALPKQLLSFSPGAPTLLEATLARFEDKVPADQRWIVTTARLEAATKAQAGGGTRVLAEPTGRNTAPCVYWAAREIEKVAGPDAVMVLLPADHQILEPTKFLATLSGAIARARANPGELVTLGIRPSRAETGYGYLETGGDLGGGALGVAKFVEKPDRARAEAFVAGGKHLWNGGMFVWTVRSILAAFDRHMPEMRAAWEAAGGRVAEAYPKMPATSIDYGVMEKAANVTTFPLECGWDDLGSWTSLESVADAAGTRSPVGVVAGGQAVGVDARGNIVDAPGKLVALLGVEDLIVVQSGDRLLVARKDRAQDIKALLEQVKAVRPDAL